MTFSTVGGRSDGDEIVYLHDEEIAAGHFVMAQIELRAQGCEHTPSYSDEHDSYYCPACDVWAEASCGDLRCTYCATRPLAPSEVE